jgi:hypothetical protein
MSVPIGAVVLFPSTSRSLTHYKITGLSEATDMSCHIHCHIYKPIQQAGYECLDKIRSSNTIRKTTVTLYKFASISGPLLVYL